VHNIRFGFYFYYNRLLQNNGCIVDLGGNMDKFITEHGGLLVSGIIAIFIIVMIFMVIKAAGEMNAVYLSTIMGD
jgi:hypothetical protein